jgi:hypothetical protein
MSYTRYTEQYLEVVRCWNRSEAYTMTTGDAIRKLSDVVRHTPSKSIVHTKAAQLLHDIIYQREVEPSKTG